MPLNHSSPHESVEVPKPDIVAGLVVQCGKLLMVHNIKHDGLRIEPPGGKVHESETLQEAVVRELQEELGIQVRPGKLIGSYDTVSPEGRFSVHMFVCEIVEGEPQVQDSETEKIGHCAWFSSEELTELAESHPGVLVPNMHAALEDVIRHINDVA